MLQLLKLVSPSRARAVQVLDCSVLVVVPLHAGWVCVIGDAQAVLTLPLAHHRRLIQTSDSGAESHGLAHPAVNMFSAMLLLASSGMLEGANKTSAVITVELIDLDARENPFHYGNPVGGSCRTDEGVLAAALFKLGSGEICAPICGSDGSCSKDVPPGVTATPACAFLNRNPNRNECALECSSDAECDKGASCRNATSKLSGVCFYDVPAPSPQTHYGDPFRGCLKDETAARLPQGGVICAPRCDGTSASCPRDRPLNVSAVPICNLSERPNSPPSLCSLECHFVGMCGSDGASTCSGGGYREKHDVCSYMWR